MNRWLRYAAVPVCVLLISTSVHAQVRGVTAEDYFAFETAGDPHISPDGSRVAFVVTTIDEQQNRRYNAIWIVPADGSGEPVPLTTAPQSSSSPRWSPDGKAIAFLSARAAAGDPAGEPARTQVWLLPLDGGGEARRLTSLLNGVSSLQWSPDGTRLVCVSRSGPSDTAKSPSDVRHYRHSIYKFNDSGWFDDKRAHLWVVEVASGRATQITDGDGWDDADPQWSPDSHRIAFVSNRTGKAFDGSRNTDVWVMDANGGPLTRISTHEEPDNSPRWSPDGQTIAFVGLTEERAHPKVWLAPATGGPSRLAADGLDLIPTGLRWVDNGHGLYFESGIKGTTHVFRIDLATKRATQLTAGERTVRSMDVNEKTSRLVYLVNDPTHLDDVYVSDLTGRSEKPLTHLNAALWKQLTLVPVERVPFKGADGWDVDGFLMKPVGWQSGK
ncbi:MAG TPA: hypothetical protein VH458_03320, partial [Vicinamibacterales bacterium]